MSSDRMTLMRTHALLAGFFLPVGVVFFITGALYTWGIKGSYETTTETMTLDAPLAKDDVDRMRGLVEARLAEKDIAAPSGASKVKSGGTSFWFEWTGSNRDVTLAPTTNPLEAKLSIKDTTLHRRMVQLHKAKGGSIFKVLAAALGVGLLLLFASGVRLAWGVPELKRTAIVGIGVGLLVFAIAAVLS